jgi:hypothetical protein
MTQNENLFTENAVAYSLYKHCVSNNSRFFFGFHHNLSLRVDRDWYYWCAPEVDVIEVRNDSTVVGYELKGSRQHRSSCPDFPAIYDAIGQAVAYLDLPRVCEGNHRRLEGGVFDFVYAVCARATPDIDDGEKKILGVVPIGAMLALTDGRFVTVKEAPRNPIQGEQAKEHFLQNLNSLEKHSTCSKIFRRIEAAGERYFSSRYL